MNTEIFTNLAGLLTSHGYWFLLLATIVEGPVVTTSAAFASASHIFNPLPVLLISILGDLVGDVFCYWFGKFSRIHLIERFGDKFGLSSKRVQNIEHLLKKNTWATLTAIKIAPALSTIGLIIAGASNIPFKKYMHICIYVTLPRSLFFVILGYYAGQANAVADKYLHHSQFAFILIVIGVILINWVYKKASKIISEKIEKV